jgi:uncharacterized membrane protein
MSSKTFDAILSFLLGSSWAFLILGTFLIYKLFISFSLLYAIFFAIIFIFAVLFFMLLLEAIDINRKKAKEIENQTKLLQEIRDRLS